MSKFERIANEIKNLIPNKAAKHAIDSVIESDSCRAPELRYLSWYTLQEILVDYVGDDEKILKDEWKIKCWCLLSARPREEIIKIAKGINVD